jgi:entericidin B
MKHTPKSALLTVAFTILFALIITGCNTMRGLGQDTERAGEKIQEKATR